VVAAPTPTILIVTCEHAHGTMRARFMFLGTGGSTPLPNLRHMLQPANADGSPCRV